MPVPQRTRALQTVLQQAQLVGQRLPRMTLRLGGRGRAAQHRRKEAARGSVVGALHGWGKAGLPGRGERASCRLWHIAALDP